LANLIQEKIALSVRTRREALGLSQKELADLVGFGSHQIVSDLERGQRDVKAWELAKIAEVLHVNLPSLLGLEATERPEPRVFWRLGAETADRPRREARLLERLDRYRRLERIVGVADHAEALPEYPLSPERASFGYVHRLASQVWRSMELGGRPAFSLVGALEERFGVKIFFDDLGSGESAACVRGTEDAGILMNRNESPWRQRFSFAHELFHLVTWDSVMSVWPDGDKEPTWSNRLETLANVFAAALVLPGDIVRTEFRSRFEEREPSDSELVDMARSYGVSTEALLWRLRNLDLISDEAVRNRLDSPDFRQLDRMTMPAHWDETPPDLPERFIRLVALAYQSGDLSRSSAAKYLEKDPGDLYYLDWDDENGSPANAGRT
jgi:Zn-dependent peptidase ImmA (M78 family)/transcriptional regulator with XRE-family HTH domain